MLQQCEQESKRDLRNATSSRKRKFINDPRNRPSVSFTTNSYTDVLHPIISSFRNGTSAWAIEIR